MKTISHLMAFAAVMFCGEASAAKLNVLLIVSDDLQPPLNVAPEPGGFPRKENRGAGDLRAAPGEAVTRVFGKCRSLAGGHEFRKALIFVSPELSG